MEPIHEDFHEAELFDNFSDGDADSQSEEPEVEDKAEQADDRADEHGESSAKSSLTFTALSGTDMAQESGDEPGEQLGGQTRSTMPAAGHIRMGSSVPVSIPHMNRWKKAEATSDSPSTQYAPATFVPPHQLSQVNEFMFSMNGDSPSVAIKRDRLRVRNAILKSTGFLEPGVDTVNNIGLQERNRLTVAAGGLSQALQQQGTVVAAAAEPVATS